MAFKVTTAVLLLLSTLASLVTAQQGVLVDGNSQLPSCAQSCTLLQQAAQACKGTTSATQATWSCFCQRAWTGGIQSSGTASVCAASCPNAADAAQVGAWYTSNCGSDNGQSEHADSGQAAGGAATTAGQSSSAAPTGGATATASSAPGQDSSNGGSSFSAGQQNPGDWWSSHYKWIIMLIVLAIFLPLLGFLAVWLKRRHDRKQDQINSGFNAGITHRQAPMSDPNLNASGVTGSAPIDGSGRNSPARTRDAFMPYGYGYNRSESQMGSKQAVYDDRRSPLARGDTPMDPEKEVGMAEIPGKKKSRRVLVRERSTEDDIQTEKR